MQVVELRLVGEHQQRGASLGEPARQTHPLLPAVIGGQYYYGIHCQEVKTLNPLCISLGSENMYLAKPGFISITHTVYLQCHIVMSITLQCIATLYMSAIAELWDILPRPDNTVHSYWLQTGSLSSVCGLSPQYRVFKCSAKPGGDCTQPGGPVSPITSVAPHNIGE